MSDLDKLIEAVEAGTLDPITCGMTHGAYPAEFPFDGERLTLCTSLDAFHGSLDAAKALHDALLPGWHWYVDSENAEVWGREDQGPKVSVYNNQHARAWLLAILKALEFQNEK